MKNKLDFIIDEDSQIYRTIFRIYPKSTTIHSFDENPPKTWKEVYKVYYSFAIIIQYLDDDNKVESSIKLFEMRCDECSNIPNLSDIIKYAIEKNEIFDYPTCGQPAGDWYIDPTNENYIKFMVFDNFQGNGFRFLLSKERTNEFIEWLNEANEYLFKHCGTCI